MIEANTCNKWIVWLFCLVVIVFSAYGCKDLNPRSYEKISKEKTYGVIYYTEESIDTDMPVSCTTFLEFLSSAISYIEIKEIVFPKDFLLNLENRKNAEVNKFLDVRYRIEIADMIICIDEWGYFCINGNYKGKLENFQLLLDYIDENREKEIQIEEFTFPN